PLSLFLPLPFSVLFFFLISRPPPRSTLFPYTTLFRSSIPAVRYSSCPVEIGRVSASKIRSTGRMPYLLTARSKIRCAMAVNKYRSEEHTSELQSRGQLVCRLLLEKKKTKKDAQTDTCG